MKEGDIVKIIDHKSLHDCGLQELIGREGTVVAICYNCHGSLHGVWIELAGDKFLNENEWFMPNECYVKC